MDTTLRDGEQTSGVSFNAREKLSIARLLLEELCVSRIEIASARVSQGEQEAVRRIARALGAVEAAVWQTLGEKRTESLIKTTALYNELFEEAAGR